MINLKESVGKLFHIPLAPPPKKMPFYSTLKRGEKGICAGDKGREGLTCRGVVQVTRGYLYNREKERGWLTSRGVVKVIEVINVNTSYIIVPLTQYCTRHFYFFIRQNNYLIDIIILIHMVHINQSIEFRRGWKSNWSHPQMNDGTKCRQMGINSWQSHRLVSFKAVQGQDRLHPNVSCPVFKTLPWFTNRSVKTGNSRGGDKVVWFVSIIWDR